MAYSLMLSKFVHATLILMNWSVYANEGNSHLRGHLKPLGSHTLGKGVTAVGKFSSPSVFFSEFVSQRQPIWMRNALDYINHVGLTNWTDEYIKAKFGHESVNVEVSKKENRQQRSKTLTMRQFIYLYKEEDMYLVHSLRNSMEDLVLVPPSLACGGFQKTIQDAVMWLGSGTTMSVLHYDMLDNLLCLFDGEKNLVLIDEIYKEDVEADGFVQDQSYSLVDVEHVDMTKFPRLGNISWKRVRMRKGDCVYIPKGWYHQVTSSTDRHLAINYWFSHLYWFNETDCPSENSAPTKHLYPIREIGFASSNEVLRSKLLDKLHDKGIMTRQNFISSLDSSNEERKEKFFNAVDKYKDSALSWSELYSFDIDKAVLYFPDIFDLPGGADSPPDNLVLFDPIVYAHGVDFKDDERGEEDENHSEKKSLKDTALPDESLAFKEKLDTTQSFASTEDSNIEERIDENDKSQYSSEAGKEKQESEDKEWNHDHKPMNVKKDEL
ncbi:lysine-specific demethylase 8-like [Plakobranchus ocellatus]|uniref:Lysine-specific demethylase 8-like n=1 Tax=Plakobranchus ocellatus TaxID=259542 RepID=A0AAV4CV46_9GAST|nr:lysine-specific demethylase 8-like [Plakobranchus ocellatus]